ncbi:MAG: beta-ketoacyl-ACP synthase [Gammaproteobacteria bacterium]|nr:beta-ketoacyl-ACP synthase [Gammaproteobacteria bacterium]MDH5592811.1 beta-ketoacyl-ACP synthase [Gammaproteobacteria bacterium]
MKRVVVTGMAGVTSLGNDWDIIKQNMQAGKTGIKYMPEWNVYEDLNTRLAAPIVDFKPPSHYTRKQTRSMGRVSLLSTVATEMALDKAGLLGDECLSDGSTGVAYGSSTGSTEPMKAFGAMLNEGTCRGVTATSYIRMMGHTAPVNISLFFGIKGRIIVTSTACTSGSQGIGYAYEAIKFGKQKVMIAGGAEELCPTEASVFDTLYATSIRNGEPHLTPRPFDKDRDGLVIGEGAGTLILEELEFAKARGANIIAEVIGFGTNCDAAHVTQPTAETMQVAMELGLQDAGLDASNVGYISAHGTATETGDVAESKATEAVFGSQIPISSLKSYYGHSLGACGAIEAWLGLEMMRDKWFAPTVNLDNVSDECAKLDYIIGEGREIDTDYMVSNNFAFGGINTSLVFKRWA